MLDQRLMAMGQVNDRQPSVGKMSTYRLGDVGVHAFVVGTTVRQAVAHDTCCRLAVKLLIGASYPAHVEAPVSM